MFERIKRLFAAPQPKASTPDDDDLGTSTDEELIAANQALGREQDEIREQRHLITEELNRRRAERTEAKD